MAEKPKKVIEEYDSEEEEVNFTKSGYIEMKQKKQWKPVYCVLLGGSLYYYKNANDPEPKGKLDLEGLNVVSPVKNEKRKTETFALQKGEELLFVGSCSSGVQEWTKALQDSLDKEKTEAPTAGKKKLKKASKKTGGRMLDMASKTAATVLGKKPIFKLLFNEETMALLASLKKIVKESGGVKKAEDLERNIFKIFVKVYTLICCGVINAEEFLSADKPVREAFELLVRIYNGRDRVKAEKISEALRKVESLFKRAEEILIQLLSPYLSTKNMLRVSLIFSSLMDIKFLETVLRDASLEADLVKLVSSMEVYTQVQYH